MELWMRSNGGCWRHRRRGVDVEALRRCAQKVFSSGIDAKMLQDSQAEDTRMSKCNARKLFATVEFRGPFGGVPTKF